MAGKPAAQEVRVQELCTKWACRVRHRGAHLGTAAQGGQKVRASQPASPAEKARVRKMCRVRAWCVLAHRDRRVGVAHHRRIFVWRICERRRKVGERRDSHSGRVPRYTDGSSQRCAAAAYFYQAGLGVGHTAWAGAKAQRKL